MSDYKISGIVNVDMYNSILDPGFVLELAYDDIEDLDELLFRFDSEKYKKVVLEQAVIELKELLKGFPKELQCKYVEGSAYIYSPPYYNYSTDTLYFKVTAETIMSPNELQEYLANFFLEDWEDEFGAAYRIYEYISLNYCLESFCT